MSRLLAPFFLMCMAGIIGLYLIAPQYEEIRLLQGEEVALLKDLEDVKTINDKIAMLSAQYAAFPPGAEEKLHVLLPSKIDMVRLIIDINALVEQRGLTMRTPAVSITAPDNRQSAPGSPPVGTVQRSSVRFEVLASYDDFRALLSDLEKSLAVRDVGSVTFSAGEGTGSAPQLNKAGKPVRSYNIELGTYSYSE